MVNSQKPQTCTHCRTRKVKCDGGYPCTPCLKSRRPLVCVYERLHRVKVKVVKLYKRGACLPCRRRKRRCDAVRPSCSTCQNFRKAEECVYQTNLPEFPRYQTHKEGHSREIQPKLSDSSESRTSALSSSVVAVPVSSTPRQPPFSHLSRWKNVFSSLPEVRSGVLKPTIIPNPFLLIKLGDICDESAFALSDVSLNDLNMKFRLVYLSRRLLYGIYLPFAKQQALLSGDTSNTALHPFFVHFAHLVGCQLYQEHRGRYDFFHIQAMHLRLTLEALSGMKEEEDPFSLAQANFFLAMATGYAQNLSASKRYLKRSVDIIRRNNIRFVPISTGDATQQEPNVLSPIPHFSEEVHEKAAFLAQMLYAEASIYMVGQQPAQLGYNFGDLKLELPGMYSDIYVKLVGGQPEEISFDLEMQFRYELPEAYPILFETCPMVLRVRSMILAKDANNIIAWYQQEVTPPASWISTCRIFLSYLTSHIDVLTQKIQESKSIKDGESCLCLRYSVLLSLTNLAQIAYVLVTGATSITSSTAEFQGQCSDALSRVLLIIGEFEPGEFLSLNPLLGTYFSRAISLFKDNKEPSPLEDTTASTLVISSALSTSISGEQYPVQADDSDLETLILVLAQHTDKFINNRFIPGTIYLCQELNAYNGRSRP